MPPHPKVSREDIVNKAFNIVREEGIESLNARYLASKLNCSTQPIFKQFVNMEELKQFVKEKIDLVYQDFIEKRVDENNHLLTMSIAYIEFAREESSLFSALFIYPLIRSRNMEEVLSSSWNLATIEHTMQQYQLTKVQAEELYRDIRFYSHGIASQLCTKTIILTKKEIEELINNVVNRLK